MNYTASPEIITPSRSTFIDLPAHLLVTPTHNLERPYEFFLYPEMLGVEEPLPLALTTPYPNVKRNLPHALDPENLPSEVEQVLNNPSTRFQGITPGAIKSALRYGTSVTRNHSEPIKLATVKGLQVVDKLNGEDAEYKDATVLDIPCTMTLVTYDTVAELGKGGFFADKTDTPKLPGWFAWEMVEPETLLVRVFAGDPDSPYTGELIHTERLHRDYLRGHSSKGRIDWGGVFTFDFIIRGNTYGGLTVAGYLTDKPVRDGGTRYLPIGLVPDYNQK